MPRLLLAIGAYVVVLPYLDPQTAAAVLVLITAVWLFLPRPANQPDPGFAFLLPVLPFLATSLLAVLRAPDRVVASAVLSFYLPGLVVFIIMMREPGWRLRHWLVMWTAFCTVMAGSVLVGWVLLLRSDASAIMKGLVEGPLVYAHNQFLLVPNDISVCAVLLVCPVALLADRLEKPAVRGLALLSLVLTALAMVVLRTRTGFMVAGAEVAVLSVLRPRLLLLLPPVCLALAAVDYLAGIHALDKLLLANHLGNHGVDGRLGLWVSAWNMFTTAPLLGHGAQAFGPQHGAVLPEWSPRFPEARAMWAHNLFLETLADQGVLGLLALTLIFLQPAYKSCVLFVHGITKRVIKPESAFVLAAITGFAMACVFELTFIRRWVPLVMFGLAGLVRRGLATRQAGGPRAVGDWAAMD